MDCQRARAPGAPSVRLNTRRRLHDDMRSDVLVAVCAILDRGLRANRKLAFDLRVAIDLELQSLRVLALFDV
jgi:hypothetical protein